MGTAIVAIPAEDDYVWQISSEKVPHLTLLFLGDQSENPKLGHIESYLEHVVNTSLEKFGLDVSRRGELGPDHADVLFFSKTFTEHLYDVRSYLLSDPVIREAYNSVEQYPAWVPHLTLGFPETPAHPDKRDYPGVTWVNFDRIALWIGDYTGPEFQLKSYGEEVAMSETDRGALAADQMLAHYGVKGMKWGVRKSDSPRAKLGLQGHSSPKPSEDKATANASAAKIRRGNTDALSNRELQQLVNRMNLEQQYSRLSSQSGVVKRGQQGAKDILSVGKTANEAAQFAQSPLGKAIGKGLRRAAFATAAAAGRLAARRALKR